MGKWTDLQVEVVKNTKMVRFFCIFITVYHNIYVLSYKGFYKNLIDFYNKNPSYSTLRFNVLKYFFCSSLIR